MSVNLNLKDCGYELTEGQYLYSLCWIDGYHNKSYPIVKFVRVVGVTDKMVEVVGVEPVCTICTKDNSIRPHRMAHAPLDVVMMYSVYRDHKWKKDKQSGETDYYRNNSIWEGVTREKLRAVKPDRTKQKFKLCEEGWYHSDKWYIPFKLGTTVRPEEIGTEEDFAGPIRYN